MMKFMVLLNFFMANLFLFRECSSYGQKIQSILKESLPLNASRHYIESIYFKFQATSDQSPKTWIEGRDIFGSQELNVLRLFKLHPQSILLQSNGFKNVVQLLLFYFHFLIFLILFEIICPPAEFLFFSM